MDRARRDLAHLYRRAGFGASPAELDVAVRHGLRRRRRTAPAARQRRRRRRGPPRRARPGPGPPENLRLAWLYRMLLTRAGRCRKRWCSSGTATSPPRFRRSAAAAPGADEAPARAVPRAGAGQLARAAAGVSRDGAMLDYLNNRQNRKAAPNENYARELMELFTLGIGNYTEHDIKEAARAFTGWTTDGEGDFIFNAPPARRRPQDVLRPRRQLRRRRRDRDHPRAPGRGPVRRRKAVPLLRLRRSRARRGRSAGGVVPRQRLRPCGRARRRDPALRRSFRSEKAYPRHDQEPGRATRRRAQTLGANPCRAISAPSLRRMGQDLLNPPSVKGWDGGQAWINAATLLERFELRQPGLAVPAASASESFVDPAAIARPVPHARARSSTASPERCSTATCHVQSSGAVGLRTGRRRDFADADAADRKIRGLVHLVMASPIVPAQLALRHGWSALCWQWPTRNKARSMTIRGSRCLHVVTSCSQGLVLVSVGVAAPAFLAKTVMASPTRRAPRVSNRSGRESWSSSSSPAATTG